MVLDGASLAYVQVVSTSLAKISSILYKHPAVIPMLEFLLNYCFLQWRARPFLYTPNRYLAEIRMSTSRGCINRCKLWSSPCF
jgi:hypothetical protein